MAKIDFTLRAHLDTILKNCVNLAFSRSYITGIRCGLPPFPPLFLFPPLMEVPSRIQITDIKVGFIGCNKRNIILLHCFTPHDLLFTVLDTIFCHFTLFCRRQNNGHIINLSALFIGYATLLFAFSHF